MLVLACASVSPLFFLAERRLGQASNPSFANSADDIIIGQYLDAA